MKQSSGQSDALNPSGSRALLLARVSHGPHSGAFWWFDPESRVPGGVSSQQNGKALGEQEGQEREGKAQPAWGWGCLRPKPGNMSLSQQSSGSKVQACHSPEGKTEATDPAAAVADPLPALDSDNSRHCLFSGEGEQGWLSGRFSPCHSTKQLATTVRHRIFLFVKFRK